MSLINQMLRDLEKRKTDNNTPPELQQAIQVTPTSSSKTPFLIWGLLAIAATASAFWAYPYQYSKTLAKAPAALVVETIKNAPVPMATYEAKLGTPNLFADIASTIDQKPSGNIALQSIPVVQAVTPPTQAKPSKPIVPAIKVEPDSVTMPAIKKIPIASNPAPTKQISAKQQADLFFHQAEHNGDDYSASAKLEQALTLDPRHLKARLLLAQMLHNQGQTNKNAEFLDQSLALFPDNLQFINTRAQLFLEQKNPERALSTLQRIDLPDNPDETYLSLLAASYQQLQSFTNAAKAYQMLVTINPEKAENWLGLALSQEKLGDFKLSRAAYQQALSKNTLKEAVVSYIKQRLTELR